MSEVINDMENISKITLRGVSFEIQYFWGGDLKNLALIYGINAANSEQPCLWCKINKKQFHPVYYLIIRK